MALAERDPERATAALLVRRTSMTVDGELIEQLTGLDRESAIATVLDKPVDESQVPVADKSDKTLTWWFRRINDRANGLQERMTFSGTR